MKNAMMNSNVCRYFSTRRIVWNACVQPRHSTMPSGKGGPDRVLRCLNVYKAKPDHHKPTEEMQMHNQTSRLASLQCSSLGSHSKILSTANANTCSVMPPA